MRIGIVDSGVLTTQEDLAGKVVAATDCINTAGDPGNCHGSGQDDTGHGTHMAGIAAATKDNGRGIAGIAPDARLVVARALTNNGGTILDIEAGIRWVVQHGAQVVNLSVADNPLAQHPLDLSFEAAVNEAWSEGVVPVVASGNSTSLGPGREDFSNLNALVVGATDVNGAVVRATNPLTTTKWGLVAPGGSGTGDRRDILSTWRDPAAPNATDLYAFRGGASTAAAHVSGVVALLLAQGLSPAAAVQRVVDTARPMACGPDCHGLLDAAAAVGVGAETVAPTDVSAPATVPGSTAPSQPTSTQPSTSTSTAPSPPAAVVPDSETAVAVPMPVESRALAAGAIRGAAVAQWKPLWIVVAIAGAIALFFLLRRRYARTGLP